MHWREGGVATATEYLELFSIWADFRQYMSQDLVMNPSFTNMMKIEFLYHDRLVYLRESWFTGEEAAAAAAAAVGDAHSGHVQLHKHSHLQCSEDEFFPQPCPWSTISDFQPEGWNTIPQNPLCEWNRFLDG